MKGARTNDIPGFGVRESSSPWRNSWTPVGLRIYAVGDIHGRADLLRRLLGAIVVDAERREQETRNVLVFLGDYVDRGAHSREVLNILLGGLPRHFEAIFLRGNHELMMLDYLDGGDSAELWLSNGGLSTLESYGVDWLGARRMREVFLARLPRRHRAFLEGLRHSAVLGDYFFCHAGVRPGRPLDQQTDHDLLWIRSAFLDHTGEFGKVIVHGHTPTRTPTDRPNRIGVDTRAWQTGRLTAAVLEEDERRFLWTCDSPYAL